MRRRKSIYLSSNVANQYPTETFKNIIFDVVDIVDSFILDFGEEENIDSSSISKYEEKLGSFQRVTSSKVEAICLNKIKDDEKKKEFILKYGLALENLNEMEKKVFVATFIDGLTNNVIIKTLGLNSELLTTIRKSAIIRFSLKMGLNKFIHLYQ